MPTETVDALNESETLEPWIAFPEFSAPALPIERSPFVARFAPAGPTLHRETVLPSLPVVVPVEKRIVPDVTLVDDPSSVAFVTVLPVASLTKRIVEAPVAALVFEIVSPLPPVPRRRCHGPRFRLERREAVVSGAQATRTVRCAAGPPPRAPKGFRRARPDRLPPGGSPG
jgi:hypothetical protein